VARILESVRSILTATDGLSCQHPVHTIGTPLAHTSRAYTPKAWKTFDTIPWLKRPNVHVKRGTVKSVNIDSRIATYTDTATGNDCIEHYDFLVAATGLHRKWPIVPQGLTMEEYLHDALDYVNTIAHAGDHTIAVVGGGMSLIFHGS